MAPVIIKLNNPHHRQRMLMLDYDHTLVKPKDYRKFPKDADDWTWFQPNVPEVLQKYYDEGYGIYIFTNQSKPWKQQHIMNSLGSLKIPMTIAIAYDKEEHKPSTVMFDTVLKDKKCDKKNSFFVGDALGRRGDFADSDRKFGEAIGVEVKSPESVFLNTENEEKEMNYEKIKKMAKMMKPENGKELVIMVGYPGSGKSTIANGFNAHGYEVVDGDVYKTDAKRTKMVIENLEKEKSVVFDATNLTKEKRSIYIKIAQDFMIPARCIYISTSMEKAMQLNQQRPKEKQVPKIAYYKMQKTFEEPTDTEGCEVVKL